MLTCYAEEAIQNSIPIKPVTLNSFTIWLNQQSTFIKEWIASCGFTGNSETFCIIPDSSGKIKQVVFGIDSADSYWSFGLLPTQLPFGYYHLDVSEFMSSQQEQRAILAWGLGSFRAYPERQNGYKTQPPILTLPKTEDSLLTLEWAKTIYWVRQLINLPCEEMGPADLAAAANTLHKQYGANVKVYEKDELISAGYPAVYMVGRASHRAPCLIDLTWGNGQGKKVTLVGKGVCFDTGGLNIKSSPGMRNMKKDMAGAAHVLGIARMIMQQQWPVQLRVIIPAVENVISGNSIKPGDIVNTRTGLRVEVGNTDAEGRLILCDALAAAIEDEPDFLIDMATLTGAARVALGPDIPGYFTNNQQMAKDLEQAAELEQEPLWRLPLYQPYKRFLKSEVADCNNISSNEYGGAITAALYLQQFVPDHIPWAHFDLMAWNDQLLPGRPVGGEAMALRTVFAYLWARSNNS